MCFLKWRLRDRKKVATAIPTNEKIATVINATGCTVTVLILKIFLAVGTCPPGQTIGTHVVQEMFNFCRVPSYNPTMTPTPPKIHFMWKLLYKTLLLQINLLKNQFYFLALSALYAIFLLLSILIIFPLKHQKYYFLKYLPNFPALQKLPNKSNKNHREFGYSWHSFDEILIQNINVIMELLFNGTTF